jgi:hypothetical protein
MKHISTYKDMNSGFMLEHYSEHMSRLACRIGYHVAWLFLTCFELSSNFWKDRSIFKNPLDCLSTDLPFYSISLFDHLFFKGMDLEIHFGIRCFNL